MPWDYQKPKNSHPQLLLAPMQGLIDALMRDILTRIGGFDGCVTEFVRITHTEHNRSTWLKYMPELAHSNQTRASTPVIVQLLGSNADNIARNAGNVVKLGADQIDLNFGCPAPTVNQHAGGAILLREPNRIEHIVRTVRQSIPAKVKLSAKMRLGYENKKLAIACAQAIEQGGAQQLTVHARTKIEGYQPPAHWEWIARIKNNVSIPVVANGDVFNLTDYQNIRMVSECNDVMLGRGAVQQPDLGRQIAAFNNGRLIQPMLWTELICWIEEFFKNCSNAVQINSKYSIARLKQWLAMLKLNYQEASNLFNIIRTLNNQDHIAQILHQQVQQNPMD